MLSGLLFWTTFATKVKIVKVANGSAFDLIHVPGKLLQASKG